MGASRARCWKGGGGVRRSRVEGGEGAERERGSGTLAKGPPTNFFHAFLGNTPKGNARAVSENQTYIARMNGCGQTPSTPPGGTRLQLRERGRACERGAGGWGAGGRAGGQVDGRVGGSPSTEVWKNGV